LATHSNWVLPEESEMAQLSRRGAARRGAGGQLLPHAVLHQRSCSAGEREIPTTIYSYSYSYGHIQDAHVVEEGLDVDQILQAYRGYQALVRIVSR